LSDFPFSKKLPIQCIISALKAESVPLVHYFGLERNPNFNFPVFSRDDLFLIGIGVGTININSRVQTFIQSVKNDSVQFINIGTAGGKKNISKIGNIYLINKIIDDSSKRVFYPDILLTHSFDENILTTVAKGVKNGGNKYDSLVDMEASEIFKVCSKIVSIHNISFLKIVSDYMDLDQINFNQEKISFLIKSKLGLIKEFLNRFKFLKELNPPILNIIDQQWIQNIESQLLLTRTQTLNLISLTKGYRIRQPNVLCPQINISKPQSKTQRNRIYKNICAKLTA